MTEILIVRVDRAVKDVPVKRLAQWTPDGPSAGDRAPYATVAEVLRDRWVAFTAETQPDGVIMWFQRSYRPESNPLDGWGT